MTNSSPPESPNPIPERRRRPATGVTFDEIIAIIVAFSTIGTILFWAMGGRNNRLVSNFGLGDGSNSLSGNQTTDTGLDFGGILAGNTDADAGSNERNLTAENRRLAAQLQEQEQPVAYIPPNESVELPAKVEQQSFSLDSGAKLVPLAGVTVPALANRENKRVTNNVPEEATPETNETAQVEPTPVIPVTPETTQMPGDVVPDYWAYPFVKQMRDEALVPELAKNQEFDPDALITRASMATLVSQAFEGEPETESVKQFSDVTEENEIAQDIDKAVRTGFMQGYPDNEFKPLENIPRYQVLVTLATGLGLEPSQDADQILQQFGDSSDMPDWAKQQVAAAAEAGLVVNPPDADSGSLVPQRSATRAEVAAMIHQALVSKGKLQPLESEFIVQP